MIRRLVFCATVVVASLIAGCSNSNELQIPLPQEAASTTSKFSPVLGPIGGVPSGVQVTFIGDSVAILGHLFQGVPLECADAGDFNDTGELNITDVVAVLEYLFRPGGALPPPPFPESGVDPTPDNLVCR